MRLNPDCVRDILLTVEENTGLRKSITFTGAPVTFPMLVKYPLEEVLYHVQQCDYAGYLVIASRGGQGTCIIDDLTPEGHGFLESIRDVAVHEEAKSNFFSKAGAFTIKVFENIAAKVIADKIAGL